MHRVEKQRNPMTSPMAIQSMQPATTHCKNEKPIGKWITKTLFSDIVVKEEAGSVASFAESAHCAHAAFQ
jgi:hypothetical protein